MAEEKRRRLSPKARRDEILQASKELFAEQGYENTQLQQIAARIGASRSIFAPYFKGKEEIYDALFALWEKHEAETRIRFPLIEDSAVKSLYNVVERMTRLSTEEYNEWAGKDVLLDKAIKSRTGAAEHIVRVLDQNDLARYSLQPIMAYGQLTGELRKGDPLLLAQLLLYMIEGILGNIRTFNIEVTDEMIEQIIELFRSQPETTDK